MLKFWGQKVDNFVLWFYSDKVHLAEAHYAGNIDCRERAKIAKVAYPLYW